MANVAEAGSGKKNKTATIAFVTHPDAEQRKNLLAEATAAAAKKLRDEAAAKRTAAAERAAEAERALVREATVEFLRFQFGKKQAPKTPELMEKLKKACKCHFFLVEGSTKTNVLCTRSILKELSLGIYRTGKTSSSS